MKKKKGEEDERFPLFLRKMKVIKFCLVLLGNSITFIKLNEALVASNLFKFELFYGYSI